jgi:hypothetical protein
MQNYIRAVEKMLFNYKTLKVSIENLKLLYDNKVKYGMDKNSDPFGEKSGKTNKVTSETEIFALDLVTLREKIELLETKILIIENALGGLNDVERDIVISKYVDGLRWFDIAYKVQYNERWCRKIKDDAVRKLCLSVFAVDIVREQQTA